MTNEDGPTAADAARRAVTLQVLLAEYALLQGLLAQTWGVVQSRTTVLLGMLSAVAVTLGLAAQRVGFGSQFVLFALVLIGAWLSVGLATFVRVTQASRETVILALNQNRIRHYFVEVAPDAAAYLSLPIHDDEIAARRGVGSGMPSGRQPPALVFGLVQIPGVVAVVNALVAGAGAGLALGREVPIDRALAGAVGVFLVVALLQLTYWYRSVVELRTSMVVRFPSEPPTAR